MSINHLAVFAATFASFFIGFLWYGPILGKVWMKEAGLSEEKIKNMNLGVTYTLASVLIVVQAYNLAALLANVNFTMSIVYGLLTGAGWVATSLGIIYLFENRSKKLFFINAGYLIISFIVMSMIIGAWK